MLSLKFILKSGEGKKNRVKIISVSILSLFLFQAIMMVNVSNNNTINSEENLNNDLNVPIEEVPITPDIETIEIEEISDEDLTIVIENEENFVPEITSSNALLSKISSYQGTDLNNNILAKESFVAENSVNNLVLQNSFNDLTNIETTSTLDLPISDYSNTDHSIIVDNTKASFNYEHIEYESSNYLWLDSSTNLWQSVATSFDITEPIVNITQIRLAYLKFDSGNLQGEAYITDIIAGKPGTTKIGGQSVDLTLGGGTNSTLSFSQPVTLTAGTYAIVLTETSNEDDENIFRYKYMRDDNLGDLDNETQMWQKSWGGSWASVSRDLFFSYEYLTLNPLDYSQAKEYSTPEEVNLLYTLNGNSLDFTSDSPITFDLSFKFVYESNNAIEVLTDFAIDNNTVPTWESGFTHPSSPSGAYTINSRNMTIFNIPLDWKGIQVDQNGNIFSSDPDNDANIIYTNETSELTLLLGGDTNSITWLIHFVSPNYINSLTLKENDLTILNSPYKITSPDTLRIIANMDSSDQNSNGSLFIFDPSDIVNYFETNVLISSNALTYNIWDPSITLDLNEDNSGIYSIVTHWIDSSLTKIGFFETTFELMLQTDLNAFTDSSTYLASEIIHLSADFSSALNGTILDSADITYLTGWDSSTGALIQSQSHGSYLTDISVGNAPVGLTSITIYASLEGYVSKSVVVPITITQEETSLDYNANGTDADSLDLHYQESISLSIHYISYTNPIFSATVEVNGSLASEELDGSYSFIFDTRNIPYISSFIFVINASKTSYLSKDLIISFNMDEAYTKINLQGLTPDNNSVVSKYFSYSSSDLIDLQLQYQESTHETSIQNALVTHNASSTDFSVSLSEDFNNLWTIQLDPETIGHFVISFTFNMLGYQQLSYVISIQIDITPTSIIQDGHPNFNGIDSTISITYDPDSYTPLVLFVTYYDSIYNDVLNDGLFEAFTDGLNVSIVVDQFVNGTYILELNPLGNGIENITINFNRLNYQSSTLKLVLELEEIINNDDDNDDDKFCEFVYKKGNQKHKYKIKKKLCKILKKIFENFKNHKGWVNHSQENNKYYFKEFSKATPCIHDIVKHCMKYKHH